MEKLSKKNKFLKILATAFNLGLSISIPIAGGALLGMFLDDKFHTHPRLTLSFLFAGVFVASGAIFNVIKEARD